MELMGKKKENGEKKEKERERDGMSRWFAYLTFSLFLYMRTLLAKRPMEIDKAMSMI